MNGIDQNSEVRISRHAYQRMKERNGWNHRTADRMAVKIYQKGIRAEDKKGYIGVLARKCDNYHKQRGERKSEYIIYGKQIYVFSDKVMVTVLTEPKRSSLTPFRRKLFREPVEAIAV